MEGVVYNKMKPTYEEQVVLRSVFIGHIVIQTTEIGDLRKRFFELTQCNKCGYNHSTLSECKDCTKESCGVCWGSQKAGDGLKCPCCNHFYSCVDKENAPTLYEYLYEKAFKGVLKIGCPFCKNENLDLVSVTDDRLDAGKEEFIGSCGLSSITEKDESEDTILMQNLIEHIRAKHLVDQQERDRVKLGKCIATNLPLKSKWRKSLILCNNILGKIKAANEKGPLVAVAQRSANLSDTPPSTFLHQQPSECKTNKHRDTSDSYENAAKRRCVDNFNNLSQEIKREIVQILNGGDQSHESIKKISSLSRTDDQMGLNYFINRGFFIEVFGQVKTEFDPGNLTYMERPVSFQDKDPRMMKAMRNLTFSLCRDKGEILSCILLGVGFCTTYESPIKLFSNCIFNNMQSSEDGSETITLNYLRKILIDYDMKRQVEAIDNAQKYSGERISTDNKVLASILSTPLKELAKIEGLQVIKKIKKDAGSALVSGREDFLILLFHKVCQPEDRHFLDETYSGHKRKGATGGTESDALRIIEELIKQNKPLVVFYEALEFAGYFTNSMKVELERWADENKDLFLQQS